MSHDTEYMPKGATLSAQAQGPERSEELVAKPPFDIHIVLFEPEIPPNTGNAGRLCVATQSTLHIVGRPGFSLGDKAVRRAGLDYWKYVQLLHHENFEAWFEWRTENTPLLNWFLIENAPGAKPFYQARFPAQTALIFGKETVGLPKDLLRAHPERVLEVPMFSSRIRSLNLANTIALTQYEVIRQNLPQS